MSQFKNYIKGQADDDIGVYSSSLPHGKCSTDMSLQIDLKVSITTL